MRKVILTVVILFFAITVIYLITNILIKVQKQKTLTEKISVFPSFSFMTLTNETFNSSDIQQGPILLVRFHPECEHCQYEISEILKSSIPSSDVKILLVSSYQIDSIKRFLDQFNYSDFPSVIPLADTSYSFGDIFGNEAIPSNYIYDKDLKLVKVMHGEMKTETIIKYLAESEQSR
jgi:hypothetical protein